MTVHRFAIFGLLALLAACAAPQEQRLYLLEPPRASLVGPIGASVVAVRAVDLPAYARATAMVHIVEDGSVQQSDVARWADDPSRAATVTLANQIADRTGADVVTEPWPSDAGPEAVVSVLIERFIGALGGELTLSGRYSITGADRRVERASSGFSIVTPTQGPGFEGLARAHGVALDTLAAQIVQSLR